MGNFQLRHRILLGFFCFTILQFILMLALSIYSYHVGEDGALARVVSTNSALHEYRNDTSLPTDFKDQLIAYAPGVHELSGSDRPELTGIEVHAYKYRDDNQFRYRLLQLSEQKGLSEVIKTYALLTCIAIVLISGFGGWAGHTIAVRLSRPVEDLTDKLNNPNAMDGSFRYASPGQTGEVAVVAAALDNAVSRINETRERETTLSRNISHELRTPLTVIRTALDTGSSETRTPSPTALTTARRACEEMELLTNACLDLAREQTSSDLVLTDIVSVVKEIIKESLHLLDEKAVQFDLKVSERTIQLPASEPLARLVLGNVIRNGFIHCSDGPIVIELDLQQFTMTNLTTASDTDHHPISRGFGVGLSIMGQTCRRLKWHYQMLQKNLESGISVTVTVDFTNI